MPRPQKWRKVCCLPKSNRFGPADMQQNKAQPIIMAVDEYETVRLIDLQGFTQEECAEQMKIARTTVQRIYKDARKKIADCLVNGKTLLIEGGEIELCDGLEMVCRCGGCRKHRRGNFNNINESENEK